MQGAETEWQRLGGVARGREMVRRAWWSFCETGGFGGHLRALTPIIFKEKSAEYGRNSMYRKRS